MSYCGKTDSVITIYGIANCDKCRKALRWFDANGYTHQFHDLRKDGLDKALAEQWLLSLDAGQLLNRRSTTWRQLTVDERERADNGAADLLVAYPTLAKRPLVDTGGALVVGYDEPAWRAALD